MNPSTLLIFIYFSTVLLSIPHLLINGDTSVVKYTLVYQDKYWIGAIAFILFLFLFIFPLWYFKETKTNKIVLPDLSILNLFSVVLILMSLYSIGYYLPSVFRIFTSGSSLSEMRSNLDTIRVNFVNENSIFNTIASVCTSMYPFVIMLFFIYYIIGEHRNRCILLFFSSTSIIINVLSYVGRDGVVFWALTFMFMYLIFHDFLTVRQQKTIRKTFIMSATIIFIPFLIISVSRFGSSATGTGGGILSYLGQMLPNYCLYFDVKEAHYNYGSSFPLFWEIIGEDKPVSIRWIDGGTESNVFGTFIKGFNANFGIWGTILVGMLAALFFIMVYGKRKSVMKYYHYFVYILYFQVLSQGVFYFRQSDRGGNLFFITCIIFFLAFYVLQTSSKGFTLIKNDENAIKKR